MNPIIKETLARIAKDKLSDNATELAKLGSRTQGNFNLAVNKSHGLIAELKLRSPSGGKMRNISFSLLDSVVELYNRTPIVEAISVVTGPRFGLTLFDLKQVKRRSNKPILHKDFIIDKYQIDQSCYAGADAILLIKALLQRDQMEELYSHARSLGMQVVVEVNDLDSATTTISCANMVMINSRDVLAVDSGFKALVSRLIKHDITVDHRIVDKIFFKPERLSNVALVAASGITPKLFSNIYKVYDACLVGNYILNHRLGVQAALDEFDLATKVRL